jgi:hypothetical protein
MTWTELLTSSIAETYKATEGLMSLVQDEDLAWKPATGKNWMTTGQLLHHLTNACGLCCQGFVTGDWGMPEGVDMKDLPPDQMLPPAETLPAVSSVAEARRLLDADRVLALRLLLEAGEERLDSELVAAPWDAADDQRRLGVQMLSMVEHLQQHKGQLFYYLKLQGKDVNTMHLYGMG